MLYTKEELIKKYAGKYIDTYPHHYAVKDNQGSWTTVYEVRRVSNKIRENCQSPDEI